MAERHVQLNVFKRWREGAAESVRMRTARRAADALDGMKAELTRQHLAQVTTMQLENETLRCAPLHPLYTPSAPPLHPLNRQHLAQVVTIQLRNETLRCRPPQPLHNPSINPP
eukprot:369077-Prorocentrum_minimum.AAC.1